MDEKNTELIKKIGALYMKYGIRSVTMDDVARELGISKKTLYQHFEDKNDIVKKVISHYLEEMDKELSSLTSPKMNAIEIQLMISDSINRFVTEFNPSVNFDLMKYHPEVWAMLLNYKREHVYQNVRENILQGVREGLYRKDLKPEVIARLYVSRIKVGMDMDMAPVPRNEFGSFFKEFVTYHIRGIASQKGLEIFEKISKEHKLFQEK